MKAALTRVLGWRPTPVTVANFSLLVGLGLIGYGLSLVYLPAAFVTVGVLVVGLTIYAAERAARMQRSE